MQNKQSWQVPYRTIFWKSSWCETRTSSLPSPPWRSLETFLNTHQRYGSQKWQSKLIQSELYYNFKELRLCMHTHTYALTCEGSESGAIVFGLVMQICFTTKFPVFHVLIPFVACMFLLKFLPLLDIVHDHILVCYCPCFRTCQSSTPFRSQAITCKRPGQMLC